MLIKKIGYQKGAVTGLMIAAHVVWGAALAAMARGLLAAEPDPGRAAGPRAPRGRRRSPAPAETAD